MKQTRLSCSLAAFAVLPFATADAAVTYAASGSNYSQDFNTLSTATNANNETAAWANDSTLTGWYASLGGGTTPTQFRAWDGNAAKQGELLSLGSTTAIDRALGGQNLTAVENIRYGLQLSNSTGTTLSSFTLGYTGEQWRRINLEAPDSLTFDYQIFASGGGNRLGTATGWNSVSALTFTAPVTGTSAGVNGNTGGQVVIAPVTTSGISWAAGQELWLRWTDNNPNGASGSESRRFALGIDDVSFSAVPEPALSMLAALGVSLAGLRRRRP